MEVKSKVLERIAVSVAGKTGKVKQRKELQLAVAKLWLEQVQKRREARMLAERKSEKSVREQRH